MHNSTALSRTTKLIIAVAFVLYSAYNLVLTALQDYILFISSDAGALGISFGIFTLAAVLSRFLSGWIIEKIDDVLALVLGNIILTIALGLYPLTMSVTTVYIIRAVQGFGWALSTVTILTMIVENTENAQVSKALGYLNGFGSLSLLLFPVFGSYLVVIKSLETFTICFYAAFGISVISTGLSIYAWISTPPIVAHEVPVSGLPDRDVLVPTLSAFLIFMVLGVLLSYSPEIAVLNGIQNPGFFFSIFAFAQIIGSAMGGIFTGSSQYGKIATIGALFVMVGVTVLVLFNGIYGYFASAFIIGLGLASANISLTSYVSSISTASEAKGMAIYSAGVDSAIAVGSFSTAILLGVGWTIPTILSIFVGTSLISSIYSFFAIRQGNS
ncbi:MAG: MFS transporter [Candidatus Thorarchaeota archaeon]|nr:MAG: MFS transporter [Candidatus Thorarchaeota archaeon]